MGKPGIRETQNKKIKKKLLNTALKLFREHGYYNVSVDEIVEKANSSKGAFYNHFGSKDEVIIFYLESWDPLYLKYYKDVLLSPDYPGKHALDKIRDMFLYIISVLAKQGEEVARVSSSYLLRDFNAGKINIGPQRKYISIMTQLIHEGREDGSIPTCLSDEELMRILTILSRGVINDWGINRGSYDIQSAGRIIIDMFCQSIGGRHSLCGYPVQ